MLTNDMKFVKAIRFVERELYRNLTGTGQFDELPDRLEMTDQWIQVSNIMASNRIARSREA